MLEFSVRGKTMDHNRKKLTGIIPPLVTPLDASGKIDEKALKRLIEYCIQGGVSGIFMLGSCGEGTSLTGAQKRTAVKCALEAAEGIPYDGDQITGIEDGDTNARLFQMDVYIGFDLISLTFDNGEQEFVIPVVSDPIDTGSDSTGAIDTTSDETLLDKLKEWWERFQDSDGMNVIRIILAVVIVVLLILIVLLIVDKITAIASRKKPKPKTTSKKTKKKKTKKKK